jgi:DNA-binding HxlR family transcriptional regulator
LYDLDLKALEELGVVERVGVDTPPGRIIFSGVSKGVHVTYFVLESVSSRVGVVNALKLTWDSENGAFANSDRRERFHIHGPPVYAAPLTISLP